MGKIAPTLIFSIKTTFSQIRSSLFAGIAVISFAFTSVVRGADLGEALQHAGWAGILGTWVDADTKGEIVKSTYAWKFEGKLIEVNASFGETKSVAFMSFDPENKTVYHVSGDDKGGGSIGKWSLDGEDAVLDIQYRSGDGEKGTMKIRHHKVDDDTMQLTTSNGENDESLEVTLVRSKK
ncbi:MAG: hypothetical protein QNL71_01215 [Akkermansiaceae bacterium]